MKTILIVEDDGTMRELLRLHLTTAGYAVFTAANGAEAWTSIAAMLPDMIITDVNMPRIGGFEFVAALRERSDLAAIPVIFLTIEHDSIDRGNDLGAVEYLTKPIRLESLLQKVAKHLPPRGA